MKKENINECEYAYIYSLKVHEKLSTNKVSLNKQDELLADEKMPLTDASEGRPSKIASMNLETPISANITENSSGKKFFSDSTQSNVCDDNMSSKARRDAATAALRLKISQKAEMNDLSPAGSFVSFQKNNSQISLKSQTRGANVSGIQKILLVESMNNSAGKSSGINTLNLRDADKRSNANIEYNRSNNKSSHSIQGVNTNKSEIVQITPCNDN